MVFDASVFNMPSNGGLCEQDTPRSMHVISYCFVLYFSITLFFFAELPAPVASLARRQLPHGLPQIFITLSTIFNCSCCIILHLSLMLVKRFCLVDPRSTYQIPIQPITCFPARRLRLHAAYWFVPLPRVTPMVCIFIYFNVCFTCASMC